MPGSGSIFSFSAADITAARDLTLSGIVAGNNVTLTAGNLLTFGGANLDPMIMNLTATGNSIRLTSDLALASTVATLNSTNGLDATGFDISGSRMTLNISGGTVSAVTLAIDTLTASNTTVNAQLTTNTLNANGGTVTIANPGGFTNTGTVNANAGTLNFSTRFTQTGGTFQVAGANVQAATPMDFQAGTLTGFGSITADIVSNALIRPGLGGNGLIVNGSLSLLANSQLSFQLGGLTQGSQYGFISVNGAVTLGGNLVLSFANGFQNSVNGSTTLTLMTTSLPFSGSFANVASGGRLETSDNFGSFLVTYSGGTLVLSGFAAGRPAPRMLLGASANPTNASPGAPSPGGGLTSTGRSGPGRIGSNGRIAAQTPTQPSCLRDPRSSGIGVPMQNSGQLRALVIAATVQPGGRKAIVSREAAMRARAQETSENKRAADSRRTIDSRRIASGGAGENRGTKDRVLDAPRTAANGPAGNVSPGADTPRTFNR